MRNLTIKSFNPSSEQNEVNNITKIRTLTLDFESMEGNAISFISRQPSVKYEISLEIESKDDADKLLSIISVMKEQLIR